MERVIEQLRARRQEAGISISELARRMGTDRARISEIENGHVGLTLKRLYQYAEALGLSVTINFK